MPPPPPEPEVDHPDLYIPEPVKLFIPNFQKQISEKVSGCVDHHLLCATVS